MAITPVIVNPAYKMAIPLAPEFIVPQNGNDKQDCETNTAKRWFMTHADKFRKLCQPPNRNYRVDLSLKRFCQKRTEQFCLCISQNKTANTNNNQNGNC